MHKLLFRFPLMEEAGAEGGGGQPATTGDEKPFLGGEGEQPSGETPPDGTPEGDGDGEGEGGQPAGEGEEKPATPEDYDKALVVDEKIFGKDSGFSLDHELMKSVAPIMQAHGIKPEVANELANALAKAQVDQAREATKARHDYFEEMKQASLRKYTPNDFKQINAGIDKWFKRGGIMNNVIRNSELGADPEFLALMHHLGAAVAQGGATGVAAGAGGSGAGDGQTFDGMSKIW